MKISYKLLSFLGVMVAVAFFVNFQAFAGPNKIKSGSTAVIEYSLEVDGKNVTQGEEMQLVVGGNKYPELYEKQLIGLKPGDQKVIKLSAEQAFGPERPELLKRVPKSQLPPNVQFREGMILGGKNGQAAMRVVKVLEDSIVLDQNHPLAGRNLVYNIKVKSVN